MPGVNTSSPFTEPVPVAGSPDSTAVSPFADAVDIPTTGHGVGTAISPFAEGGADTEVDETERSEIPPKTGKGSTIKAWTEYAEAHGLEVPKGVKVPDIIDTLEEAGVPVEAPEEVESEVDPEKVHTEVDETDIAPA